MAVCPKLVQNFVFYFCNQLDQVIIHHQYLAHCSINNIASFLELVMTGHSVINFKNLQLCLQANRVNFVVSAVSCQNLKTVLVIASLVLILFNLLSFAEQLLGSFQFCHQIVFAKVILISLLKRLMVINQEISLRQYCFCFAKLLVVCQDVAHIVKQLKTPKCFVQCILD